MNRRERHIYNFISANRGCWISEAAKRLGYEVSAVEHSVARLMKKGYIYLEVADDGLYPVPWQKVYQLLLKDTKLM